jgi:hypothetical protein
VEWNDVVMLCYSGVYRNHQPPVPNIAPPNCCAQCYCPPCIRMIHLMREHQEMQWYIFKTKIIFFRFFFLIFFLMKFESFFNICTV